MNSHDVLFTISLRGQSISRSSKPLQLGHFRKKGNVVDVLCLYELLAAV